MICPECGKEHEKDDRVFLEETMKRFTLVAALEFSKLYCSNHGLPYPSPLLPEQLHPYLDDWTDEVEKFIEEATPLEDALELCDFIIETISVCLEKYPPHGRNIAREFREQSKKQRFQAELMINEFKKKHPSF